MEEDYAMDNDYYDHAKYSMTTQCGRRIYFKKIQERFICLTERMEEQFVGFLPSELMIDFNEWKELYRLLELNLLFREDECNLREKVNSMDSETKLEQVQIRLDAYEGSLNERTKELEANQERFLSQYDQFKEAEADFQEKEAMFQRKLHEEKAEMKLIQENIKLDTEALLNREGLLKAWAKSLMDMKKKTYTDRQQLLDIIEQIKENSAEPEVFDFAQIDPKSPKPVSPYLKSPPCKIKKTS